jgi:tricorn protease
MRLLITLTLMLSGLSMTIAQVSARLFQYPDVSDTHITFVYAGDIWVAPKEGGTANKLSSPAGQEAYPRFSPDGAHIAFSGNYNGNTDIYVIPTLGGLPKRLTCHGMIERTLDWSPDGEHVLFASSRESGRQRYSQFYTIATKGGQAEKLPVPYGEYASFSPDGQQLAYTPKSRAQRTWKRYRGGMATDIFLFNLETFAAENITDNPANDEFPMWHGSKLYFLSDRGADERNNIWMYDLDSRQSRQITRFKEFDIHYPAIGPEDIVFEAGGQLFLLDLATDQYREVDIEVVTDEATLAPRAKNVAKTIQSGHIAPDGKRALLQARGELFSLPAEHGYVKNMTQSTGTAERYPAWSPNGRYIAYWSDQSGEYELTIRDLKNSGKETKLTSYGAGFRYQPYWSPDSKKIAFIDEKLTVRIFDMDSRATTDVDQSVYFLNHYGLENFHMDWSPDSRWLTYSFPKSILNRAIYLYDSESGEVTQVTSGFYSDNLPVFDPEGKYLYFLTNRHFSPLYSDFDNSFVYPNATQVAAVALRKDVDSPLAPRNDEVKIKEDEEKENGEKEEENGKDENGNGEKEIKVDIDFDGFEQRVVLLPPDPGNYANLSAAKGKVIYLRVPDSGSDEEKRPIVYFDLEEREEKTIIEDADDYLLSADGKKLLVRNNDKIAIIDVKADQKIEKTLATQDMEMTLDPRAEWRQIFNDAWRFQRDLFYDPGMHGVDWQAMRKQYGALIEQAVTRWDVNFILGELIAELNASHTYRGGGDTEDAEHRSVGYLGVDWSQANGHYRIERIIRGATWDAKTRSPLDQPGVDVLEGDYILAVNGVPLTVDKEPYAAFDGLAGKTVELSLTRYPDEPDSTRSVFVELLSSETRLRHLAWIESNRKRVEEASDGQIGYIYVRSTGRDGQSELVRQFQAQFEKPGLIVDERFNSGGQIPDRFVELLNRPALAYWDVRYGKSWQWPPVAHFGPQVMLINGWSGSGGDAFPDYFRKAGLGPLIGTRTWGGLIGVSGAPQLVDGGYVTVPTFRMYDPDGEWFKEGHGVDPDIEVPEDPSQLAKGTDPQLERAIREVLNSLEGKQPIEQSAPQVENRSRDEK